MKTILTRLTALAAILPVAAAAHPGHGGHADSHALLHAEHLAPVLSAIIAIATVLLLKRLLKDRR